MQDKDIYTLALIRYRNEYPNINVEDMFSNDWNLSKDYRLKTIIIANAIKDHVLVEETELYKDRFVKKRK